MDDTISRLNQLSARLNKSSDQLSATIERIEQKFSTLRLGVPVEVEEPIAIETFMDANLHEKELRHYLAYKKVDGTWRLVITKTLEESADLDDFGRDFKDVALQQAPRELRIKALQKIPTLLLRLETKATQELDEVEKALKILEGF